MHRLKSRALRRFLKYAAVGGTTFAFDLLLIWVMTELFLVPYAVSTALGFLAAVSLNYLVARRYVFQGTTRRLGHGYAYFLLIAALGAVLIALSVAGLVEYLALHYLVARILVACVVGILNYLFNLHLNFRVAGHHP